MRLDILKNLELICSGERFIEATINLLEKSKNHIIKTFVTAFNHYIEKGAFGHLLEPVYNLVSNSVRKAK